MNKILLVIIYFKKRQQIHSQNKSYNIKENCHVLYILVRRNKKIHIVVSQEYERMTKRDTFHPEVWTYLACCYFFLGMYQDADEAAQKGMFKLLI